jgi:fatty acid-binding protein DegV
MQIVASASANLSPSEVASYAIAPLPTRMMVDGVEHHVREGYGIADVDRWVKGARAAPHNVGSTASELVEILLEVSSTQRELLLVLPSHKIIGTHQAAVSATRALLQKRSKAGLRVEIAELGSTDCAGALAAIYAGEACKAGLSFDQVVAATRAFAAAAIAASLEAQLGSSSRLWVAVAHGGCEPEAVQLVAELKRRFRVERLVVRPCAPPLHLHLGRDALAAFAAPIDDLPWAALSP